MNSDLNFRKNSREWSSGLSLSLIFALTLAMATPKSALAVAFGQYANLPSSLNVASIVNTFQSPGLILPLANAVSQAQAQMQASIPSGTPVWDGYGPLPGAVGTGGFNPTFSFDSSGCSVIPMNFNDVYAPSMTLPTVWCGAVSQTQSKAVASSSGGQSVDSLASGQAPQTQTRAMQLQ